MFYFHVKQYSGRYKNLLFFPEAIESVKKAQKVSYIVNVC